jgi:hypothetical protein
LPGSDREIAHLALNAAEVAAVAAGDDAFLEYLGKHCLMKGFLLGRGNSAIGGHFAADHAHGVEEREPVGGFLGTRTIWELG